MFYNPKQMLSILKRYTQTYNFQELLSVVKTVSVSCILVPKQIHHTGSFLMKAPTRIVFSSVQQCFKG